MKTILTYDTETTGIPIWSTPSEDPSQPRITSIAAELCEEATGRTLGALNVLIKPDGWTVPEEVTALTGITTALCEEHGVPIAQALSLFIELWTRADMRVGHNESFDMRMIRIELIRHPQFSGQMVGDVLFADYWKTASAFCTQGKSTKLINLPPSEKMVAAGRNTPKSPNLGEAYRFFTGADLVDAHSAQADMLACKAVYYGIKNYNMKKAA